MPTDGFVSTDAGVRLFAHAVGNGPAVVLFPNGLHLVDDFAHLAHGRTLVFFDVRNRGRSDAVADPALLADGVLNDVADLEAVRRHFGAGRVSLIGHSYAGLVAVLYARKYSASVSRVVQIGPMQPNQATTYPPELSNHDETYHRVISAIGALQEERASREPFAFCRRFWQVLQPLFVTDAANAERLNWGRCELPNERAFMKYWLEHLLPSMQRLKLTREELAGVTAPVMAIHGTKDRSSPYGASRDWVALLPNARLVTIDGAGHAPWIEEPQLVFGAIDRFLDGRD